MKTYALKYMSSLLLNHYKSLNVIIATFLIISIQPSWGGGGGGGGVNFAIFVGMVKYLPNAS